MIGIPSGWELNAAYAMNKDGKFLRGFDHNAEWTMFERSRVLLKPEIWETVDWRVVNDVPRG